MAEAADYVPGEHDVIFGRGSAAYDQPGNKKFRTLCNNNKARYKEATKQDKPNVSSDVVNEWRSMTPRGKFLKIGDDNIWHDVGDGEARKKVSQTLRDSRPEQRLAAQQQQELEQRLGQQLSLDGRDALKDVDLSSSVVYHASLQFPSGFIEAIEQLNPNLAHNLIASKVGESSTIQNFLQKMSTMAMYFPFGKLVYTAFVIPPGLEFRDLPFISEDAEKAFHVLFTTVLLKGEWYFLDEEKKQQMQTRLEKIGCTTIVISATLDTAIRQNSGNGPKGWNYFAKLLWSDEDKNTITSVGNNNHQWKDLCDTMLGAIKVGCSIQLKNGKQEIDMTDYDSDDEEQNKDDYASGKSDRGAQYIWALSQLADTEWFRLTEEQVNAELDAKNNNRRSGSWVRELRGGVKTITSDDVNKFLGSECIEEGELRELIRLKQVKRR